MEVEGWMPRSLGDLVSIKHGWPFKSELFATELTGHPVVVSVGNFRYSGGFRFGETLTKEYRGNYPAEYELSPGDILLIMTCQTAGGEILGIPARVPDDGRLYLHNQRLGKVLVRDAQNVDSDYLYWLFHWQKFNRELVGSASGTKILHTAPSRIEAFRFCAPPISEQRAIAHILCALDNKIELNRRMNETLETMAQALFKSWFVDFDPVRAKSEGRDPGLPKAIADLFSDSFEDSELGAIPAGWRVGRLGDVAEHPKRTVCPEELDADAPYIALEHMPRRSIALSDWSVANGLESNKFAFQKGEILFGKLRPYFHKVGVAPLNGVCSTDIVVVAPKARDWFGFVLGHVSSDAFVEFTNAGSTGTKMPRTSWHDMSRYEIAVPPLPVAGTFTGLIKPSIDRISAAIFESRTLAAIRDALLPKLISGEIRVKDAEKIVEKVA
jgi:type I restriction enzyme S subunit